MSESRQGSILPFTQGTHQSETKDTQSVQVQTEFLNFLVGALADSAKRNGTAFIRLRDERGLERGAYIDSNTLNLLLKLQSILQSPENLERFVKNVDDDKDYKKVDLRAYLQKRVAG